MKRPLTTILFLILFPIAAITWIGAFLFYNVMPVQAARYACASTRIVEAPDTWETISYGVNINVGSLIAANKSKTESPNWPLYDKVKLCIPEENVTDKVYPSWVAKQGTGIFYCVLQNNRLRCVTNNFGVHSHWRLTLSNGHRYNWLVPGKGPESKTIQLARNDVIRSACMKNMLNDVMMCVGILKY